MDSYICQSPILLIVYKRVDTLKAICQVLQKVQPKTLYIASNAPKNSQEANKVKEVRAFLESAFTWQCELKTLYRDSHLNAKCSISSAISWFFSLEERGIILEDDCLPSLSFFRFCDECLEKYNNTSQVFMISGWSALDFAPHQTTKTLSPKASLKEDYYFSKYNHIWGWASWARAWGQYQLEFSDFKAEFKALHNFCNMREKRAWHKIFKLYARGQIDTWDYPWTYSIWKNNGLCIYPKDNMIQNIGFNRDDAAHTKGDCKFAQMPTYELHFPLKHPTTIAQNKALDKLNFEIVFDSTPLILRIYSKLKALLKAHLCSHRK
ncbi:methyltransferase FkbM [Helicobacter marmotae]|uniref:Methyltransferase FkbM n=1 Tax=Helicobacter marmotae TaxID=152490 RepID=A0A3D8I1W1_9HELI|nr:methyltransferase FkbM [Helicobacter marmotae]RDU59112.1 methyltransferase FkbM [Helicobacter marmotae]